MTVTQVLFPEHVLTHGRILWVPELQPEWTNAGFSLRFRGTGISVHTLPPEVQPDMPAYFDLSVDGRSLLAAPVEMDTELLIVNGLEEGEHLLRVRKRSETRESPVRLSAVTVEGDSPAILPPPAPSSRRMEFLGDSLTCGFGNEAEKNTPIFLTSEEDGTRTAAALTAAHFGADDRYECISGQGVVRNCNGETDRPIPVFFHWGSPHRQDEWDFSQWQPHVVVINAGTNDVSGQVEPELFREKTAAFLRELRRVYPEAWLIWGYGMCNMNMESAARQALEDVGDERAVYLPFMPPISEEAGEVGACGHPNLKAHRRFADILIRQVAELTGWQ